MKHPRFWWWLSAVAGCMVLGVLMVALEPRDSEAAPPLRPGNYELHTEKLQDGTFCVIAQSRAGSAYGAVALSCDFTCRDILNEGAVCK